MDYVKNQKEAIAIVKQMVADGHVAQDIAEKYFPELKESEGEKMIQYFKDLAPFDKADELYEKYGFSHKDAIAWLEKQGEQKDIIYPKYRIKDWIQCNNYEPIQIINIKNNAYVWSNGDIRPIEIVDNNDNIHLVEQKPADKVKHKFKVGDEIKTANEESLTITKIDEKGYWSEDLFICYFDEECKWDLVKQKSADKIEPKFKVGDWVVYTKYGKQIQQIQKVYDDGSYLTNNYRLLAKENEPYMHLWTIQDAKDGDVLTTNSWLYLFKYTNNKAIIQFHCTCPINGKPYKWSFSPDESYLDIYIDANIHPATKEQRDLFFQKMKEAGYEWDAEKKELKKAESKSNVCGVETASGCYENDYGRNYVKIDDSAWSE